MFSLSHLLISALCLTGSLTSTAAAPVEGETNADRLARGLSPAAPRRLYDPSSTRHYARQAQNSVGVNDPINAFILVTPTNPTRKREMEMEADLETRGPQYNYLYDLNGAYTTTGTAPDTWTFYPSDATKTDAKVYTVRSYRPSRKAKRLILQGWWGAWQQDSSADVSSTGHGILGFGIWNTPSSATGFNPTSYSETNVVNKPVLNQPVALTWYNAQNQAVYPKFYLTSVGGGTMQLYAALKATDIAPTVSENAQVTLTWVAPVNRNSV